jgi:uncharacterized membrane protein
MSGAHAKNNLEKEFELERVILFSDAVFAIALTLLVIDIKFPEIPEKQVGNFLPLFRPTIVEFLAFAISFFFVGNSWARHLKLFRHLKKYDQGLITRNLIFLFFIVIFPFTASGISGHVRAGFPLPVFLYIFNITGVSLCHFIICHYIFYTKPGLSIEGEVAQKKYIYIVSKYNALWFLAMSLIISVIYFIFPGNDMYLIYSIALLSFVSLYIKAITKKYKPRS